MKSLKHPWAHIGIPGPCYRRAVLGAAVTWHVGISLIKGSTLFSFRSVMVMRCKQRECQTSLLQFLDLSFQIIWFSSPVNHHAWLIKPWTVLASRTSVCMALQLPTLSPSIWDTTTAQKLGADRTQKGLNHLPWPCCPSGLAEQRAETWRLSVAHSSIWRVDQGRDCDEQNCYSAFAARYVLYGIFLHFYHLFI